VTAPKELQDFGYTEYGYGNWIKMVEKEGDYGKFFNLESGITIAGKDEEGKIKTEARTKSWFRIPMEVVILDEIAHMCEKAADSMRNPGLHVEKP